MPQPLISLENVSFSYSQNKNWALNNISLCVEQGELIAVMGENGSGKSTLCKLLNGIIPHSQQGTLRGTVIVDGIVTADSSVAELAGRVGMVLEDPDSQLFTARVRDEIAFGLENLLMPPDEIKKRLAWALETTGLLSYMDAPPASLSGGQKQRLAIAAALAMATKALVLDEPTAQLDPAGSRDILSLIKKIRQDSGLTVIMATHASEEAAQFADRICVLKNGTLAACDTPQRVFSNRELLRDNWIRPPQVSELAYCLAEQGESLPAFPIQHDEAKAAVLEWYANGK
ncbi:MAG: ATP-binding cassette domain-containing protein [Treponema sp.]|jgi:energy-coupling factor transport system ATP-binding protein|nr:ATP-binding cassette domain-containing protein [Treponema sp.]